jgi:hypothetical protein
MKKIYLFFTLLILALACKEGNQGNKDTKDPLAVDTNKGNDQPNITKELVGQVLQSIPSPLEISILLKQSQIRYNKNFLNNTASSAKYNTNFKRAINLGIYSTDLGYCNIYNQNQEALLYLDEVKTMADGLNIGQFFDMNTIRRMATNKGNLDSLLIITQQNYERISVHLQDQGRSDQSILILTGGWIESLHLMCEVTKTSNDKDLRERIGNQKVILDQLLLLLSYYNNTPQFKTLITELTNLQKQYEQVKITYSAKEPVVRVQGDIIVVEDPSETIIEIPDNVMQGIYQTVTNIRKMVTE